MARRLKVFRTAAGFHDAYVAAPSRKAALAAWGSDADLFARGIAEEVSDAALMEAPLAHPGEVVRVSRGSVDEQIAAASQERPKRRGTRISTSSAQDRSSRSGQKDPSVADSRSRPKPAPKPSRASLDAAENALAEAEAQHRTLERDLADEQRALDKRRRQAADTHERERAALERSIDRERAVYDAALARWRG